MVPDLKLKDYYLAFINNAEEDKNKYNERLKEELDILDLSKTEVSEYIDFYKTYYNLDITNYSEWKNAEYNKSLTLYNRVLYLLNREEDYDNRSKLLQLIKYCNTLSRIYETNRLILLADKRQHIKISQYRDLITDYYNKVHAIVLKGDGYKFSNGIGVFCINRWKYDAVNKSKRVIDYKATRIKKQQLIDAGKKLYNERDAQWYKARNIPYDGIDYRVFKEQNHWYEYSIIHSTILSQSAMVFTVTDYINVHYRGMTYEDMAEFCKNFNDIVNLQVDISVKLNILLIKYPNHYLKFIRNADQQKYKYRTNNC